MHPPVNSGGGYCAAGTGLANESTLGCSTGESFHPQRRFLDFFHARGIAGDDVELIRVAARERRQLEYPRVKAIDPRRDVRAVDRKCSRPHLDRCDVRAHNNGSVEPRPRPNRQRGEPHRDDMGRGVRSGYRRSRPCVWFLRRNREIRRNRDRLGRTCNDRRYISTGQQRQKYAAKRVSRQIEG